MQLDKQSRGQDSLLADVLRLVTQTRDEPKNICVGGYGQEHSGDFSAYFSSTQK